MSTPYRRPRSGFTLVEVMMATVILVVGFMGMIEAITIGSELLAAAERQTLANQIIAHEFDRLRQMPWSLNSGNYISGLATGTTSLTIDSQFNNALATNGGAANWTLTRTVTDLNPNSTSLRSITVTVTWTKSGTTTAAAGTAGTELEKLSYFRRGPIRRTYTRSGTVFFGPSGLNLTVQRQ